MKYIVTIYNDQYKETRSFNCQSRDDLECFVLGYAYLYTSLSKDEFKFFQQHVNLRSKYTVGDLDIFIHKADNLAN